jgi:tRNA uridine 5-carbamoylmethylation protein Kti12
MQELALQRNMQRQGSAAVPAAVVAQLAAAFEAPQPHKHTWEAATLTVNSSSCSSSSSQVVQHTVNQGWSAQPAADCDIGDKATAAALDAAGEARHLAE